MNEEQILKGRLSDLARRAYNQNAYTYSNFLSMSELAVLEEMRDELAYIGHTCCGGYEAAEQQMLCFGSEAEFGYAPTFPICAVKVVPLMEKFSDNLTHRDYLGALMNLGMERDMLGDILIKEKTAYIICAENMAEYIVSGLSRVKHTVVRCEKTCLDIPELAPTFAEEEFPVSSLRLDGIIASLLKCSRSEALALFEERRVFLNGRATGRNSTTLKEGDVFSVRGHGKFIFDGTGGTTRKGKQYVRIRRYV